MKTFIIFFIVFFLVSLSPISATAHEPVTVGGRQTVTVHQSMVPTHPTVGTLSAVTHAPASSAANHHSTIFGSSATSTHWIQEDWRRELSSLSRQASLRASDALRPFSLFEWKANLSPQFLSPYAFDEWRDRPHHSNPLRVSEIPHHIRREFEEKHRSNLVVYTNSNNNNNNNDNNNDQDSPGPPVWYLPQNYEAFTPNTDDSAPEEDEDSPKPFRGSPPPQSIIVGTFVEPPTLEINPAATPPVVVPPPRVALTPLSALQRRRLFRRRPQVPTGEHDFENANENSQENYALPGEISSHFERPEDLEKYMKDSIEMLPDDYKRNYSVSVEKMCARLSADLTKEFNRPITVRSNELKVTDFDVAVDPDTGKEVFETKGLVPVSGRYRPFSANLSYKE